MAARGRWASRKWVSEKYQFSTAYVKVVCFAPSLPKFHRTEIMGPLNEVSHSAVG